MIWKFARPLKQFSPQEARCLQGSQGRWELLEREFCSPRISAGTADVSEGADTSEAGGEPYLDDSIPFARWFEKISSTGGTRASAPMWRSFSCMDPQTAIAGWQAFSLPLCWLSQGSASEPEDLLNGMFADMQAEKPHVKLIANRDFHPSVRNAIAKPPPSLWPGCDVSAGLRASSVLRPAAGGGRVLAPLTFLHMGFSLSCGVWHSVYQAAGQASPPAQASAPWHASAPGQLPGAT
jgi:hypothetical protein